jgi:hypothetical protein
MVKIKKIPAECIFLSPSGFIAGANGLASEMEAIIHLRKTVAVQE